MREIKFRAWDKENKKMLVSEDEENYLSIYLDGTFDSLGNMLDISDSRRRQRSEELELMQFTGLKDKNGKEIYEGDIVDVKYWGIGSIIFMDKAMINPEYGFCKVLPAFLIKKDNKNSTFLYKDKDLKVIGNIYENPKLMERD